MAHSYHYQSFEKPVVLAHFDNKVFRCTVWKVPHRGDSDGIFISWWFLNHLQWYYGTTKCDGSESHKATVDRPIYVYTDEPKELKAFRWRRKGPSAPVWDNMGGT